MAIVVASAFFCTLNILFSLVRALPVPNGQIVRKVVSVESVVVDAKGNIVKVIKNVVDLDALQANNNDLAKAINATKLREEADNAVKEGRVPVLVDLKAIGDLPDLDPDAKYCWQYARLHSLRNFVEIDGSVEEKSVLKAWSPKMPFSSYTNLKAYEKDTLAKLKSKGDQIDVMYISSDVHNKLEYILSAYSQFSDRALIWLQGCKADGDDCKSAEAILKAADWKMARESTDHVLVRGNVNETRPLLDQMLDGVFEGLLSQGDRRYKTMRRAAELAMLRGARVFVETGTARDGVKNCGGDGCSTIIFGRLMERMASIYPLSGPLFYTVDILPQAIKEAREAAVRVSSRISYHAVDSLKFLDSFGQPIDLLYLDSYDFDGRNPEPSQMHHLKELLLAWDKLHSNSIIIVDDCGLSSMGKCKLVDSQLMYAGWRLDTEGYQRVYVKQ